SYLYLFSNPSIHPSIHPSIVFDLSGAGSWRQQAKQVIPDISPPSKVESKILEFLRLGKQLPPQPRGSNPPVSAQSYCREKYTDLATAENQEEMDTVVDVAQRYFHGHVWIGLHHEMTPWKWSLEDDSYYIEGQKEFRMWESGEPNQVNHDCVALWENGFWKDQACIYLRKFICSTGKKTTFQ
uniref:C-type lectin domain-containing protein n=1 Tax=Amphiprion percula TaxID=161767 RepID=A0A3P8U245_AMPPE